MFFIQIFVWPAGINLFLVLHKTKSVYPQNIL